MLLLLRCRLNLFFALVVQVVSSYYLTYVSQFLELGVVSSFLL